MLAWLRRGLLFVGLCAGVVGCVLTTDLDGLSGSAPDDAAIPEAGADVVIPIEGGPSGEAGTDAPPVDFCAGAQFCDRFDDEGRTLQGAWAELQNGLPTMMLGTDAFSPPRALKLSMDAVDAGASGSVLTMRRPLGPGHSIHFELRVKMVYDLVGFDSNAYAGLITFLVDNKYVGSMSLVQGGFSNGVVRFEDGGTMQQDIASAPGAFSGRWVKLVFDETFSSTKGHIRVEVDGTVVNDRDLVNATVDGTEAEIILGLSPSGGQLPHLDAFYDDVYYR